MDKSDALYRIMDYDRVVQLFVKKSIFFAHPSLWTDDLYETRVKHSFDQALYAQCWCTKSMSDAMWRIFSKNFTSLRIRTTRPKLLAAMRSFVQEPVRKSMGFRMRVQSLKYLSTGKLNEETKALVETLKQASGLEATTAAADILCLKRSAFDHEKEVRAIIFCPSDEVGEAKKGVSVDVEPHDFVESVLIDPRATDEMRDTIITYFRIVLKYEGPMERSTLYQRPETITVDDDDHGL